MEILSVLNFTKIEYGGEIGIFFDNMKMVGKDEQEIIFPRDLFFSGRGGGLF